MNGTRIGLALLCSLALVGSLRAEEKKVEGDLKKLQGKWVAAGDMGGAKYTFDGVKLKVEGSKRVYAIEVVLDEKAKPEKSIDLKIVDAPEDAKGQTSKGIYKFDGEKFVFCFRAAGERPEKFEQIGFEQLIVTLEKEKDSK